MKPLLVAAVSVLLAACTSPNATPPWDAGKDRPVSQTDGLDRGASVGDGIVADTRRDGLLASDKQVASDKKTVSDKQPVTDKKLTDGFSCAAGAFLSCKTASVLQQCNATGTGTVLVDCSPYLCDATSKRCAQCDPKAVPFCQGGDLISCTSDGLLIKTPCPGGCVAGGCVSCTKKPYYLDADNDGYGNPAAKVDACAQPWGFVANNLDCDDLDPAAHPGQTAFFNVPTKGTGTYDYNCDKLEERELPSLVNCVTSGMTCVGDGWAGTVPACGAFGVWAKCNKQGGMPPGCGTTTMTKIQSCH